MPGNNVLTQLRHIAIAIVLILGMAPDMALAIEGPPIFSTVSTQRPATGSGSGGGVSSGGLLGDGIDFKGGMLDWEEDDEGNRVAILRNYAVVILPQLTISARNIVLNVEHQELYAEGDVLFDESGGNAFYCDQLTFNYQEWKGLAKNIRIKMDREDIEIPVKDFLDDAPSLSLTSPTTTSLNDAGDGGMSQLKRMYVQAQELRAHDQNTFELIDAKITPSSFARPHWYFNSPAALYRQKEKIESYHNTVRVNKWPVLYFPYLIRDLQYDWPWMRIAAGSTSDYGYFIRSQWGWKFKEDPNSWFRMDKLIFDVDLFSRRGAGLGVESTYELGDWDSSGKFKLYGVSEFLTTRGRDSDRAETNTENRTYRAHPAYEPSLYRNDFRWAIDWDHYQQLNDLWDVRAEVHLYHDRDYLREYDPGRFWNAKEPTNSVVFRRLDRNWELEFLASSRLSNKWKTQTEYLPEARLTVPGLQIGDSNMFFKNDLRVGFVNKRFDEDQYKYERWDMLYKNSEGVVSYPATGLFAWDPITGHSGSRLYDKDNFGTTFRAVNEMRLEAPYKAGNVTFKPWVGLRTSYYSRTLGKDFDFSQISTVSPEAYGLLPSSTQNAMYSAYYYHTYNPALRYEGGSGKVDAAIPLGLDISSRFYSIFGADDEWRMITEPKFKWTENSRARLDYNYDVIPFDNVDIYQRQRRFSFEVNSKLQNRYFESKDGEKVHDYMDFSFGIHQYPRSKDRDAINHGARWSELTSDIVLRPTENLSLSGSISYDVDDSKMNRAILAADWRLNSLWRINASHYQYRGNYWGAPDAGPSTQTHMAVRTKLWNDSSRYSLEGAVAYEWKDSTDDWEDSKYGVRHGFNKYRATLFRDLDTFEMSVSYVRDRHTDDHGVFFALSPKSFTGFDRPPPAYTMEVEEVSQGRYAAHTAHFLDDGYRIDPPARDADIKDIQF